MEDNINIIKFLLIFTKLTLPRISLAADLKVGANALHGPQHSAQKSTMSGVLVLLISLTNLRSFVS